MKRFVNVYLLLKSVGRSRGWPLPEQGQVAVLLAIATGLPELAGELLPSLAAAQPQTLLSALVDLVGGEAATAQLARLTHHPTWHDVTLAGMDRARVAARRRLPPPRPRRSTASTRSTASAGSSAIATINARLTVSAPETSSNHSAPAALDTWPGPIPGSWPGSPGRWPRPGA